MIPTTVAAVVGFLFFIAPGLLWELLRERERPAFGGSTFREGSRIALVSVVCTGTALIVLAAMRGFVWPGAVPALKPWLGDSHRYLEVHYRLVARTLLVEVATACFFAWLPYRFPAPFAWLGRLLLRAPGGLSLRPEPALWSVLQGDLRPNGGGLLLLLRLHDGTQFTGPFAAIDYGLARDASFIALQGSLYRRLPSEEAGTPFGEKRGRLLLSLEDVRDIFVLPTV